MKKAALVTVSVIMFLVLLGVNYLLWDNASKKESLEEMENQDTSQQENLEKLIEDLYAERDENMNLRMKISDLESQLSDANDEINRLKADIQNVYTVIGDKNTIIYQMKKNIDNEHYKAIVNEWVDDINNRDYFNAYRSHNERDIFQNRGEILFTNYAGKFENIEYMEIVDFKVRVLDNADYVDEDAKNRIVFDVLFNIELVKDDEGFPVIDKLFSNGPNHFKVTMAFDENRAQWFIWTIDK